MADLSDKIGIFFNFSDKFWFVSQNFFCIHCSNTKMSRSHTVSLWLCGTHWVASFFAQSQKIESYHLQELPTICFNYKKQTPIYFESWVQRFGILLNLWTDLCKGFKGLRKNDSTRKQMASYRVEKQKVHMQMDPADVASSGFSLYPGLGPRYFMWTLRPFASPLCFLVQDENLWT